MGKDGTAFGLPIQLKSWNTSTVLMSVITNRRSCIQCPSKKGIDGTAFGLPNLLTSLNTLSLSLYRDVNRIDRPKAVTSILIFLGH